MRQEDSMWQIARVSKQPPGLSLLSRGSLQGLECSLSSGNWKGPTPRGEKITKKVAAWLCYNNHLDFVSETLWLRDLHPLYSLFPEVCLWTLSSISEFISWLNKQQLNNTRQATPRDTVSNLPQTGHVTLGSLCFVSWLRHINHKRNYRVRQCVYANRETAWIAGEADSVSWLCGARLVHRGCAGQPASVQVTQRETLSLHLLCSTCVEEMREKRKLSAFGVFLQQWGQPGDFGRGREWNGTSSNSDTALSLVPGHLHPKGVLIGKRDREEKVCICLPLAQIFFYSLNLLL